MVLNWWSSVNLFAIWSLHRAKISTTTDRNELITEPSLPLCEFHFWGLKGFWKDVHYLGPYDIHLLCNPPPPTPDQGPASEKLSPLKAPNYLAHPPPPEFYLQYLHVYVYYLNECAIFIFRGTICLLLLNALYILKKMLFC